MWRRMVAAVLLAVAFFGCARQSRLELLIDRAIVSLRAAVTPEDVQRMPPEDRKAAVRIGVRVMRESLQQHGVTVPPELLERYRLALVQLYLGQ